MKDTVELINSCNIDCCSSKPISSLFDLFIKNDNNADHLLCEIIQNLWTLQGDEEEDEEEDDGEGHTTTMEDKKTIQSNCCCCSDNELQAYLYEIDMNLEYFRNDYQEFNNDNDYNCEDINIDKLLSFEYSHEACNMLLHEMETSDKLRNNSNTSKQVQLADMFAHVEAIPEFVPVVGGGGGEGGFESGVEEDLMFDDDFAQCGGDIFENVYNYTPEDSTLVYDDTLIGDDILDEVASGGDNAHLNRQLLSAAFYLRKKIMDLDAGGSTSSSTASSLKDGKGGSFIPRLVKSTFRKPCVYMLSEGRCMRSDCRFAHDLHNITCKYWLEGECLKGDTCEFLHDFASESAYETSSASSFKSDSAIKAATAREKQKQKQQDFNLNTMDFPELGVKAETPTTAISVPEIEITDSSDSINSITSKTDEPAQKQPQQQQQQQSIKQLGTSISNSSTTNSSNKKSRKFKDNVLYSLSLPGLQLTSRKKNIN